MLFQPSIEQSDTRLYALYKVMCLLFFFLVFSSFNVASPQSWNEKFTLNPSEITCMPTKTILERSKWLFLLIYFTFMLSTIHSSPRPEEEITLMPVRRFRVSWLPNPIFPCTVEHTSSTSERVLVNFGKDSRLPLHHLSSTVPRNTLPPPRCRGTSTWS